MSRPKPPTKNLEEMDGGCEGLDQAFLQIAKNDQELVSMPAPMPAPIEPNRANSTERWRAQVARTPVAWPGGVAVAWRGVV